MKSSKKDVILTLISKEYNFMLRSPDFEGWTDNQEDNLNELIYWLDNSDIASEFNEIMEADKPLVISHLTSLLPA